MYIYMQSISLSDVINIAYGVDILKPVGNSATTPCKARKLACKTPRSFVKRENIYGDNNRCNLLDQGTLQLSNIIYTTQWMNIMCMYEL